MSDSQNKLQSYRDKRDFRRTTEPKGQSEAFNGDRGRFVIQQHDASTLHYDFRIEVDGVLKSWAVPKGFSTDPATKRLAIPTEDHPLDYADFEGVIEEGQYGAGTVLVWDRGPYRNISKDQEHEPAPLSDALKSGHVALWLEGEKLRGGFALTQMQNRDDDAWLLVKMDDDQADARRNPTSTQPKSVLSGRDIDEVADDADSDD